MPIVDVGWQRLAARDQTFRCCVIRDERGRVVAHSVSSSCADPRRCGKPAEWKKLDGLYYGCTDCLVDSLADHVVDMEFKYAAQLKLW